MVEKLQSDPISIFYPNGGTSAAQMYVWDGAKPILWNGQATFSGTISVGSVSGSLTNNNAAPAANNIGVLPAIVSTTNLGYTAGNQTLLRVDTTGALVVSATLSTTGLATSVNQTNGSQLTQVVNTTGSTQAFGAGTTTSSVIRVVLPTDQTSIPVSITTGSAVIGHVITDSGSVVSTVTAVTAITNALPAGTNVIGHVIVDSGNVNSTVSGTITATISNATISVVSTTLATAANQTNGSQLTGITTGSAVIGKLLASTPYSTTSTNTAVTVTTSAAIITAYYIGNSNTTTAAYLQLFNATAGAVTLGSTAPTQSFYIPAGAAANVAGLRKSFGTAFSIAASLGRASSTAPATSLDVNFDYE